jgi:hypothetical protein
MGAIEVEYEGTEEFLKGELLKFMSSVLDLYKESGLVSAAEKTGAPGGNEAQKTTPSGGKLQWTTETIASKLKCKTGPDLIIAACAHLTFVVEQQSFTKSEIHEKMKTAKGHYKETYFSNLTSYIQRLVRKGKLNEISKDTYALNDKFRTELENLLAKS